MTYVVGLDVSMVEAFASCWMPFTNVTYGSEPSTLSVTVTPGSANVPPTERCSGLSPMTVMTGATVSGPLDCDTLGATSGDEVAICPSVCTRK